MTGPLKPITFGKDHNFYKEVTVTSSVFGGDDGYSTTDGYDSNVFIWFSAATIILLNKGTGVIEYSFNGNTLHGELDGSASSLTKMLTFNNRMVSKIWFRVKSGGSQTVAVQSWANP